MAEESVKCTKPLSRLTGLQRRQMKLEAEVDIEDHIVHVMVDIPGTCVLA